MRIEGRIYQRSTLHTYVFIYNTHNLNQLYVIFQDLRVPNLNLVHHNLTSSVHNQSTQLTCV